MSEDRVRQRGPGVLAVAEKRVEAGRVFMAWAMVTYLVLMLCQQPMAQLLLGPH